MNIWSKVLVGVIIFFTPLYLYLAARVLKQQQEGRAQIAQLESDIERLTVQNEELRGRRPGEGLRGLEVALRQVTLNRGRVWNDCQPDPVQVNAETGQVHIGVTVGKPNPHQLVTDLTLYVFQAPAEGKPAVYLGQFRVTEVADQKVGLEPALKLSEAELQRLQATPGPWVLHDTMPSDTHDVLAKLNADQKAAFLPAGVLDEYTKDGQAADAGDAPERVRDGKYVRSLRDYAQLFVEYQRQRTLRGDALAAARLEVQYAQRALADAKIQVTFHEQEIATLKAELAQIERERDAVAKHRQALEAQLASSQEAIARTLADNRRLAEQITASQWEALRRADAALGEDRTTIPAN